MFTNILVPLDGSRAAEAALEQAAYLASTSGGKIRLVQVLTNSMLADNPTVLPEVREQLDQQDRRQAADYLDTLDSRLQARGIHCQAEILESGDPAQRILEAAERHAVDLIVLTSHGRSGLSRFLLGSVAEKVLRHASCPTLIVRRNP